MREHLGSRLGFILLSAGCAIGIGNVWKFPYTVGQNGGALFVLIYLFFLVVMGVPVLAMEFSVGRASQRSAAKMYQQLEPKGTKWHYHGKVCIAGNYLLMMFYTTVAGWMMYYFFATAKGDIAGKDPTAIGQYFEKVQQSPIITVVCMAIAVIIGFGVCSFGLKNGLERITKVMMIALVVIMVVLAVNSIFLDGSEEGIKFYLMPNVENIKKVGIANVVVAAMNQAFFTLSLGIGGMAIFGSYIDKKRSLLGEALNVGLLDTFVALTSGLIIFPACFAYGVDVNSGPSLIFITLPNIFNNIPLGRLWGSLFFVFMSFAALSTVLTVFEGILSATMELFGWNRKKACIINGIAMLLLSLPCALGFNLLSDVTPFDGNSTIMDLEDFIVSNILLPLGSLVFVFFCTRKIGWGWDNFVKEANEGKGLKVKKFMKGYMTWVIPLMILIVFIIGIVNFVNNL
ncbi:MAG: sodium-dependent transporter [Oscillospiraceae bacterium]|nr:sodium-dependent transporter [Oscillospiraceae bacterium]